jgi:putative intracellular protease/amidase
MNSILIITADGCTPDLDYAVFRMREEQYNVTIAAPKKRRLHVVLHQQEPGWDTYAEIPWYTMDADAALDEIDPSKFDGLMLPGGRAPEDLRHNEHVIRITRHFLEANKPICAISRGPLILLEAGFKGRLTGHIHIKPRVALYEGCSYIEARDEAVVDGRVVTVTDRPYFHVWIREFLALLRCQPRPQKPVNPNRVLILIGEASAAGHYDNVYFRMLEEGFQVTTAAPYKKPTRLVIHLTGGLDGSWHPYQELPSLIVNPDASFDEIDPSDYAAIIMPGGRGPEHLRLDQRCINIVRHFYEADKPMAFICHSTPILTDALLACGVKQKRLMGLDGVKADVIASGYTWVHKPGEAITDGNIVTAWRRPDHDVWLREFMNLLEKRGLLPSRQEGKLNAIAAE